MLKVFSLSLLGYNTVDVLVLCSEWLLCFSFDRSWCVCRTYNSSIDIFAIFFCLMCLNLHLTMITFVLFDGKKKHFFRLNFFKKKSIFYFEFLQLKIEIVSLFQSISILSFIAAPSRIQCDNYTLTFT